MCTARLLGCSGEACGRAWVSRSWLGGGRPSVCPLAALKSTRSQPGKVPSLQAPRATVMLARDRIQTPIFPRRERFATRQENSQHNPEAGRGGGKRLRGRTQPARGRGLRNHPARPSPAESEPRPPSVSRLAGPANQPALPAAANAKHAPACAPRRTRPRPHRPFHAPASGRRRRKQRTRRRRRLRARAEASMAGRGGGGIRTARATVLARRGWGGGSLSPAGPGDAGLG